MKAINANDVLKVLCKYGKFVFVSDSNKYTEMIDEIANLPSVTPAIHEEPLGVIYSGDGYADSYMVYDLANCPACDYEYEEGDKDWGEPFCPHCGQRLNWDLETER